MGCRWRYAMKDFSSGLGQRRLLHERDASSRVVDSNKPRRRRHRVCGDRFLEESGGAAREQANPENLVFTCKQISFAMTALALILLLAVTNVDVDAVVVPLSSDVRIFADVGARGELRREGTVTRVKVDIDKIALPSTLGPALNTYVVWAVFARRCFGEPR